MIEIKIEKNESGQKLKKLLFKYLKNAPQSFTYKMLRKKNIVLNDKKATGDELLKIGDSVKLYLSDETVSKFRDTDKSDISNNPGSKALKEAADIKIIFADSDIMVIDKPSGILSQKSVKTDYSVNDFVTDYAKEKGLNHSDVFKPSVVNRLDRNTSGIMLAGVSYPGSKMLTKLIKERLIDKYYLTLAEGEFKEEVHDISYLYKDENTNKADIITADHYNELVVKGSKSSAAKDLKKYKRTETLLTPVSYKNGYTLIKVKLITGKTHQIRAVLGKLGYPIVGERKYNNHRTNINTYQLLHSYETVFPDFETVKDILSGSELELFRKYENKRFISELPDVFNLYL